MKKKDIIRAWRDEDYFRSLSDEQRAALPEHPAGVMAIEDDVLNGITGGCGPKGCSGPNDTTPGSTALCSPCPPCYCY